MSESKSIKCDSCGSELVTHSQYPAKYSLELKTINTNINTTGVEFCVGMTPWLKETKHFCGGVCLKTWIVMEME